MPEGTRIVVTVRLSGDVELTISGDLVIESLRGCIPQARGGVDHTANGRSARAPRADSRRRRLLALFHEEPDREWRTRELVAELQRRGWTGSSGDEANKVSRALASMVEAGEIVRVSKGVHRLGTQPAPDAA